MKERLSWPDVSRGLSIIGVLILHVGMAVPYGTETALHKMNDEFAPLRMPLFFLVSVALILFATLMVTKMRVGRHVKAVGGDPQAAERGGISVGGVRTFALIASAIGASLGGIIFVAQLGSAGRFTGFMLEFQVYAALMIGGYSILRGGVGNPFGGALGLIVVAGMTNILDLTAYSPYFLNIIVGVLLMSAVLLDRLRGGDAYE